MQLLHRFCLLLLASFVWAEAKATTSAVDLTPRAPPGLHEDAIVPTAPGQIGINPVTSDIGPASQYVAPIGTDTAYLSADPSGTTHYIEIHSIYFTIDTFVTTASNGPVTTTSTAQLLVETATATSGNQSPGDIAVLLPQALTDALDASVQAAVQACNALPAAKLRKRQDDALSCLINAASKASADGGLFDVVAAVDWERFALNLANNAPEALSQAWQVLKTQAQKNKFALFLASIPEVMYGSGKSLAPKLNIPKAGVGAPEQPSQSSTPCDPSAPANSDSPICTDSDCNGSNNKCFSDPNKGCACLDNMPDPPVDFYSMDYWSTQQSLLASVSAAPAVTPAPSCTINSDGVDFTGAPVASPASWCVCNLAGKTGIYPTIPSTFSPCAYSTAPTSTISISVNSAAPSGPVTSCRFVTNTFTSAGISPTGVFTSCTCNDNGGYAATTTTISGTSTVICPTTTTSSSSTPPPSPTNTCNPSMPFSFDSKDGTSAAQEFCSRNQGLAIRSPPVGGYANAITYGWTTSGPNPPHIFLYAFLDQSCSTKTGVTINQDDCNAALASVINSCPPGGTDQKMGGAASLNCQWYNMTAEPVTFGWQPPSRLLL